MSDKRMETGELRELYNSDDDFRGYVDRLMAQRGIDLEYALSLRIVASYGEIRRNER